MGYPTDLDEIPTYKLKDEIARRQKLFDQGKCSYCERPHRSRPECMWEMHHAGMLI